MVRCPNCGQNTSGDYCQWCKYPVLGGRPARRRKVGKQAKREARLAAEEEKKRKAEEAKEAEEAEKRAKQFEESLKQIKSTCEELDSGKVGTKEAIERLKDISERIME